MVKKFHFIEAGPAYERTQIRCTADEAAAKKAWDELVSGTDREELKEILRWQEGIILMVEITTNEHGRIVEKKTIHKINLHDTEMGKELKAEIDAEEE